MSAGVVLALEISGSGAVSEMRRLAGPFDVQIARVLAPQSVRAVFG